MADERDEPTQRTEKGLEIPVPKRKDWDDVLRKVAKPRRDREDHAKDSDDDA